LEAHALATEAASAGAADAPVLTAEPERHCFESSVAIDVLHFADDRAWRSEDLFVAYAVKCSSPSASGAAAAGDSGNALELHLQLHFSGGASLTLLGGDAHSIDACGNGWQLRRYFVRSNQLPADAALLRVALAARFVCASNSPAAGPHELNARLGCVRIARLATYSALLSRWHSERSGGPFAAAAVDNSQSDAAAAACQPLVVFDELTAALGWCAAHEKADFPGGFADLLVRWKCANANAETGAAARDAKSRDDGAWSWPLCKRCLYAAYPAAAFDVYLDGEWHGRTLAPLYAYESIARVRAREPPLTVTVVPRSVIGESPVLPSADVAKQSVLAACQTSAPWPDFFLDEPAS
jgi:hypothetical protein